MHRIAVCGFQGATAVGLDVPARIGVAFGRAVFADAGAGLRRLDGRGIDNIDPALGHDNALFLKLTVIQRKPFKINGFRGLRHARFI